MQLHESGNTKSTSCKEDTAMSKNRAWAIVIAIAILFTTGLAYTGYKFYGAYKSIQLAQTIYGYKSPSKGLVSPTFTRGKWMGVLIDDNIEYTDGAHNIIPYDIDGDGKVELIANSYRTDALILYKYRDVPHSSLNWSRYVIDRSVGGGSAGRPVIKFIKSMLKEKLLGGFTSGAHYTAIADLNNDSRNDLIVAGDYRKYDIVWYEAPKDITDISAWRKHIIYQNNSHRVYHIEIGDIDGDGDQDVVFASKTDNGLGWLENSGPSIDWRMTWIDDNCTRSFNVRVADLDRDGQNDVIASEDDTPKGGTLHFYSYSGDPRIQRNWTDRSIANFPAGEGISVFEIADIDGDGDLDIVTGNHQGDVYVLENPYPNNVVYGQEWNRYKVSHSYASVREIDIGDIDRDGDSDIVVADASKNMVIWFENSGVTFYENWKRHVVDHSNDYLRWCHSVELGDVDGDGDLDIAVAAAGSNVFLLYFNNLIKQGKKQ